MTVTPFWGTCASGVKVIDPVMPGKSVVASMAPLRAWRVHGAGSLDGVLEQVDGVVAEGREGVLDRVAELGLVGGHERLDGLGAALGIHERVRREEDVVRGGPGDGGQVGRVVAVAADDRAIEPGIAHLLDEDADVAGHGRDVVEGRLLRERLDLGDLGREVGGVALVGVLRDDRAAGLGEARLEVLRQQGRVRLALVPQQVGGVAERVERVLGAGGGLDVVAERGQEHQVAHLARDER